MNRMDGSQLVVVLLCAFSAGALAGVASGDVVWSQPPDMNGLKASSEIINEIGLDTRVADDFSLDSDATIRAVVFWGGYYHWSGEDPDPPFNIVIYSNGDCVPFTVVNEYDCLRAQRSFLGYDDGGYPTYAYEAAVNFPVSASTTYWLMVQACDHPFPPLWGRQESTREWLCQATLGLVMNWLEWISMWDIMGRPWSPSFELRTDTPTLVQATTWGRVKQLFR